MHLCLSVITMSDTSANTEGLIDLHEAAAMLGVTMFTARRWVKEGKLRGFKLGGRTYRLDPADVKSFIKSNEVANEV